MSLQSFFKLTPKNEKSNVQRFIRAQWKTKTPARPFLGCDMIKVKYGTTIQAVTQEEYARQFVKCVIIEQRRKEGKHAEDSKHDDSFTTHEDTDPDTVKTT